MSAFSHLRAGCASQLSHFRHMSTSAGTLNPLPASFLRGGTSKGIFINRSFLPEDRSEWDRIFLGIMGSPDPEYGRQLNGMGGGVSSLSKIVVVGLPQTPGADFDVEYTFAQVGIKDAVVDYSGNCGNLSSMVGVFAVDEGICKPRMVRTASAAESVLSRSSVRAFNTNTSKVVSTTFPVQEEEIGLIPELGVEEVSIAGVSGKSSSIILDFLRPAGARTGRLLPSGRASDTLTTRGGAGTSSFTASLVDATNPSVFIHHADLHCALHRTSSVQLDYNDSTTLDILESVRRAGAERMSLDPSAQAQPKIAVLSPPATGDTEADIVVYALSMGVLHKAIPMTLGLCLGVASKIRDSIPWKILQEQGKQDSSILRVRHPGGVVEVGAELGRNGEILSAKVVRTGRRLMEGFVWW